MAFAPRLPTHGAQNMPRNTAAARCDPSCARGVEREDTHRSRRVRRDRFSLRFKRSLQDLSGPSRREPAGELLQEPVVEEIVAYGAQIAARVEEACVVDDAVSGCGQVVETAEKGELVVVGVAEADELPKQRQAGGFA